MGLSPPPRTAWWVPVLPYSMVGLSAPRTAWWVPVLPYSMVGLSAPRTACWVSAPPPPYSMRDVCSRRHKISCRWELVRVGSHTNHTCSYEFYPSPAGSGVPSVRSSICLSQPPNGSAPGALARREGYFFKYDKCSIKREFL